MNLSTITTFLSAHPGLYGLLCMLGVIVLYGLWVQVFGPPVYIVDSDPTVIGHNAQNNPIDVTICRNVQPGLSWVGTLAQEIFECQLSWRQCLLGNVFTAWEREAELTGHAISACAAALYDGMDRGAYDMGSAAILLTPGNSYAVKGLFTGWTRDDVLRELHARRERADRWVSRHRWLLDFWLKRRGGPTS